MDLFGVQRGFFLKKPSLFILKILESQSLKYVSLSLSFHPSEKIKGIGEEKKVVCFYFTFPMSLPV